MSRKIIGITVGTQLPKPNFEQTDPTKGDYIRGKRPFVMYTTEQDLTEEQKAQARENIGIDDNVLTNLEIDIIWEGLGVMIDEDGTILIDSDDSAILI